MIILTILTIISMVACAFFGFIMGLAVGFGEGYKLAVEDTKKDETN